MTERRIQARAPPGGQRVRREVGAGGALLSTTCNELLPLGQRAAPLCSRGGGSVWSRTRRPPPGVRQTGAGGQRTTPTTWLPPGLHARQARLFAACCELPFFAFFCCQWNFVYDVLLQAFEDSTNPAAPSQKRCKACEACFAALFASLFFSEKIPRSWGGASN